MSAKVRRVRNTLQVHFHSQTLNPLNLTHSPKTLNPKPSHFTSSSPSSSSSSSSSSSYNSQNFDFLEQFLPHSNASNHSFSSSSSFSSSPIVVNSNERRRIAVGLSKAIKSQMGFLLKAFSKRFCPVSLVKAMKLFGTRETGFAFFKLAFRDGSDEEAVRKCCVAAHILAAENLRFLAQDVVSCVVARIGSGRSEGVVEFMWRNHREYESGFSVLDTLMRGFVNVEMSSEAIGVVCRMRKVGLMPSLSAITVLFKLLLRVGDYGSVWKLFRDMVRRGPCPCIYTFNVMVLGFCRKGLVRIGESLLHVMWKFHCEPDVYTYNIVINAYCMRGRTSDALNWVHLMIVRGCKPSVVTFNTVLHALCKEGNMVQARKLFDGIHDMGVYPDVTMFNTLMDGYIKARDTAQANMLYDEMKNKGVSPDGITFNILVAGHYRFGREEDGDRLLRDVSISGLFPDSSLYDISVAGLCWAGRFDEAMEFLENMLEKGIPPSVVAFNSIIAAYSRAGLEAKAYEAYRILVRFGLTPSSSTCSSLLMVYPKRGACKKPENYCII
ncbi:pentatricopeptide repeat-containing protein [Quercus suber]|uniref:Pentatricopeptide repeat-containing protein n=1 Tax=Quercus suber TaxID=58331 RepID=A0AAW0KWA7_QUESU